MEVLGLDHEKAVCGTFPTECS